jgi:hypothetical protein
LIVFSLRQESLKLILVDEPLPEGVLPQPPPIFMGSGPCHAAL